MTARDAAIAAIPDLVGPADDAGVNVRERLWAVIAEVRDSYMRVPGDVDTDEIVDAILAAGFGDVAEARTITTREELNALPAYQAIFDSDGELFRKGDRGESWFTPGNLTDWGVGGIGLPATVVDTPGISGTNGASE